MPDDRHPERSEGSAVPSLDEIIDREAKGYRADSQPPADVMWSRIADDVASAIQPPERRIVSTRTWTWIATGAGIAAALVLGIVIGRRSMSGDGRASPTTVASAPPGLLAASTDSGRDAQMRALTLSHFAQAEVFLTEVRADLKTGRHDPERHERSRHLLARTRLIMASDAGRAPAIEQLLEDLELVLAGIAALPDSGDRRPPGDVRLLDERMRVGSVLPRLRTILPSTPAAGGS